MVSLFQPSRSPAASEIFVASIHTPGLCADHNVKLITVAKAKTLGEWAGLCKIDSEGKARKVIGCYCAFVKTECLGPKNRIEKKATSL
ncbi:hypothetical protein L6164_005718 [Bauhinia variegata]|uniref:Uncharacterized protein n=1 Tax=Bauhinia variegata TaxID=167791 RepID=A0ACB9PRN3_BAUVA|nr:hypothetical protein L6164_005718 [Bauhinia variegata]